MAPRYIGWDDMDKSRFYIFGPMMFLGVRATVYPAVYVKTLLQLQHSEYSGTIDAFRKIFRANGARGFYKGFAANALGMVGGCVYISSYESSRAEIGLLNNKFNFVAHHNAALMQNFIAGALSSCISQCWLVPLDIISQRQMVQSPSKPMTNFQILGSILHSDGVTGMYRGYLASLATHVPASAIWWLTYGFFTQTWHNKFQHSESTSVDLLTRAVLGAAAGAVSSSTTNPIDVVRTRLQAERKAGDSTSFSTIVRHVLKEEGIKGFSRGTSARVLGNVPSSFLITFVYEFVKRISQKDRPLFEWSNSAATFAESWTS
eukprot:GILJ01008378.1.p1 GENE.GILJ01008378.1~~GILJ01008378.1.p1  ORF type:complete len:331 (+),score=22.65 GILJ01008378.1:41-994(+)